MSNVLHRFADELLVLAAILDEDSYENLPAVVEARQAYEMSDQYDQPDSPLRTAWHVAYCEAKAGIKARHAQLRNELVDRDLSRPWVLLEANEPYDAFVGTRVQARAQAAAGVERANYEGIKGTLWVDWEVQCPLTGETERGTVTLEEPVPPCCRGRDHHLWEVPKTQLGASLGNFRPRERDAELILTEVCPRCGTYRDTNAWAQRPDTGENGMKSVSYREADDDSLLWALRWEQAA